MGYFIGSGLYRFIPDRRSSTEICIACGYVKDTHLRPELACALDKISIFYYQERWVMDIIKYEYAYFKHYQLRSGWIRWSL